MNEIEIMQDRQRRVAEAKGKIEAILREYDLDLQAEDTIGEHTKISVMLQFRDTKKYPDAVVAQEENHVINMNDLASDAVIMEDIMKPEGDIIPDEEK